uniref:SXP/RAL-2 family protein Ani s 5-like cation-binding domain-containing protein n=1 Tax=Strongyloides stercoralis TaxID=6248 RepID=A0A0K0EIN0_STRER
MNFITYYSIFLIFLFQFTSQTEDIKEQLLKKAKDLKNEADSLMDMAKKLNKQVEMFQKINRRAKRKSLEGIGHNTSMVYKLGKKHQEFIKKLEG